MYVLTTRQLHKHLWPIVIFVKRKKEKQTKKELFWTFDL